MPAAFGAEAVAASMNDAYIIGRSGNLQFTIGSKDFLRESPVGRFPPKTHFDGHAALADQSTIAADLQSRIAIPFWSGRPYLLSPAEIRLISSQNFNVFLNWPEGLQAITNPARIGVVLDGIMYRRSQ